MNVLAATWHCSEQGHADIPTMQRPKDLMQLHVSATSTSPPQPSTSACSPPRFAAKTKVNKKVQTNSWNVVVTL